MAIGNQFLLHNAGANALVPSQEIRQINGVAASVAAPPAKPTGDRSGLPAPNQRELASLPEVFRLATELKRPDSLAPLPNDAFVAGMGVPVDRWIFGQHNKLLPVKASVRALANLLQNEPNPAGVLLDRASIEIAAAAVSLGEILRSLDARSERHRDEAFAIAFPSSDPSNSDKSRLRYAGQFVGAMSRDGRMTGMLIDLKLVNHSPHKSPRILLTEPGWKFALLPNPLIDGPGRDSGCKFSADEIEFLMDHIAAAVPVENFAFKTTLLAIESGDDTPDALDSALKRYMPERKEKPFTDAFLTTQRAGVISRMADLGLVARNRTGSNVSYVATPRGKQFLEKGL